MSIYDSEMSVKIKHHQGKGNDKGKVCGRGGGREKRVGKKKQRKKERQDSCNLGALWDCCVLFSCSSCDGGVRFVKVMRVLLLLLSFLSCLTGV